MHNELCKDRMLLFAWYFLCIQEVRAAVSELDRNRLLQLDTDDKNDDSRKTFTRAGIERPRSSMASKVLIDNASICSDSECGKS